MTPLAVTLLRTLFYLGLLFWVYGETGPATTVLLALYALELSDNAVTRCDI